MAARLAHGAPCPVAVAPYDYVAGDLRRIGVAYSATADGHEAIRAACSLAVAQRRHTGGHRGRGTAVDLLEPQSDGTSGTVLLGSVSHALLELSAARFSSCCAALSDCSSAARARRGAVGLD